jgi:succinyl-CoA synthetase beta subunit
VSQPKEAQTAVQELFASMVKGYPVAALLAEEPVEIKREIYLAYLIDKQVNLPLLMASPAGGVDIEEVARSSPSQIIKKHVSPVLGVQDYMVRSLAKTLGIDDTRSLWSLIQAMVTLFHEIDASLVEINPLAITSGGMVALDAKLILDDKAAYRHKEFFETLQSEQKRLEDERRLPEDCRRNRGFHVPLTAT